MALLSHAHSAAYFCPEDSISQEAARQASFAKGTKEPVTTGSPFTSTSESTTDVLTTAPACSSLGQPHQILQGSLWESSPHFRLTFFSVLFFFFFPGEMCKSAFLVRPSFCFLDKQVIAKPVFSRDHVFPTLVGGDIWRFCMTNENAPREDFWKGR